MYSKTYPTTPPVHALRGVSFAVHQGELVSVVGPSGSGKSTLLHLMGTLDRPTSGDITVAGHRVSELTDRDLSSLRAHHIGFVFQSFHLLSSLTTLDNVAEGLLYTGDHCMSAANWPRSPCAGWTWHTAWIRSQPSSPGVKSSGSPPPGPLSGTPRSCWPMNPLATWTPKTATPLSN